MAFDRHYTTDDLLSRPGERKANGRKTGPDGPVRDRDFGAKALDGAGDVSGPRAGGREPRQDHERFAAKAYRTKLGVDEKTGHREERAGIHGEKKTLHI